MDQMDQKDQKECPFFNLKKGQNKNGKKRIKTKNHLLGFLIFPFFIKFKLIDKLLVCQ